MSSESFSDLIHNAMNIGVNQIAYPIDIFSIVRKISEHPDVLSNITELIRLIDDEENYFTRWIAIRSINLLGKDVIKLAKNKLIERQSKEDYELAKKEIDDALSKI
jgi:hypothetical protein